MKTRTKLWMVLLITLLLAVIFIPTAVFAAEEIASGTCGAEGYDLTWILTDDGTLTISGEGEMEGYANMSSVPWYSHRSSIKEIVIDEGVTSICDYAFYECSSLTSVTIPDRVTSIGHLAFMKCSGLLSVVIHDNIERIGFNAFDDCSQLANTYYEGSKEQWENVTIDTGNTSLEKQLHYNSTGSKITVSYNNGVLTIGGSGEMDHYLSDGLKKRPWDDHRNEITKVVIEDGVTSIGNSAFSYCSRLTSVTIPDSVSTIGDSAFSYCSGLTSVTIPDSVTYIGNSAFSYCSGLTSVTIPDSVTYIAGSAFSYCSGLTSVTIPDSVMTIGDSAFYGCIRLETVHISSIESWSKINFAGNPANPMTYSKEILLNGEPIKELVIPDTIRNIPKFAFMNWKDLESVTIPNSVMSIGNYAFSGCSGILSVTIPGSVTKIGDSAFNGCSGLKSLTISDGVTTIGYSAFNNCSGLTSVTIPDSVRHIEYGAFAGCRKIETVHISSIESWLKINFSNSVANPMCFSEEILLNGEPIKELVIPDTITEIPAFAFMNWKDLESVTIPDSVTSIGNYAFDGCSKIETVHISSIENWLKINFSDNVADPMYYSEEILLNGEPIKELVISDTITKIPAYAFYNWKKLEKVTIPDNVTSIGGDAFFGCSGLTNISIPDTVKEIGYGAFSNCEGLKKADLGEGIAAVSDDLFSDCSGLEEVVLNDNITEFGGGAFDECSSLKEITIPSALRKIGRDAFSGCSSLSAVHISDLKNWCEIVFYEEDYITASVYESNPLSLARNLYLNGELLTELTIPEGIEKINNFAFSGCKSIKKLVVPDSVKEIVRTAFWGCTNLEEIIIGDGITEIPFESFKNLKKLKKVTLGENITKISSNAFWSCSALESINIPDSVEKIESYAFAACGSLKEVHITDLDRWCRIKFDDLNIFLSSTPSTNPLFNGAVLYLNGAPVTEVVFPDDISEINMAAFYRCMSLEKVVIPENITKIGSHAFFRCENLKEIIFEGNVPETVEHESFYDLSVKAYYPCDNDQWTEEARNQVGEQLEWIPAHDYESHEWYTETEPTCKEDGEERRDCSICGGYESRTVPKFGHDYEGREWVTETEPSCSADGRATLQCNNCSEYLEKTLPAKGHTIVFDEAVEPTYTSTGLTMGQHCSVCGDVLYPQEIVPMLKVSTPTNVKAVSAGYNAVKLTWNKVPEATGYGIYRYDAAKKTYVYYKPTLELSFTDTGLTAGTNQYYRVRAYRKVNGVNVWGALSTSVVAKPIPATPTGVKAVSAGYNSVKLTWNKVAGATGYLIYRYDTTAKAYKYLTATTALSYTNTGLTTNSTYHYKVRAYRKVGTANVYGAFSATGYAKPIPATPTGVKSASAGYNSIKLTWNKVAGATGYGIYRYDAATKTYKYYKATLNLNFTDTGLTAGTNQYYRVRAYRKVNGANVWGALSTSVVSKPIPATPTITAKNAGSRKIRISWNKISGASGYEIYRSTSKSGTYSKVKTVTSGSTIRFTNSNLTKGKTYYYKVRAYRTVSGKKVYGKYSAVKYAKG